MGIPPIRRTFDLGQIGDVALRNQVSSLVTERDQLNDRVQRLELDSAALQTARADADAAKTENARLVQTNTALKAQFDQSGTQLNARTSELQQARQDIATRDIELTTLRASDAVGKQAITDRTTLNTRVSQLSDQLKARDIELTTLRATDAVGKQAIADRAALNTQVSQLADQIKARDVQIADLTNKLGTATTQSAGPRPTPAVAINTVAANVGQQVSMAQQTLRQNSSGFALANVSVRLKAMAGDGGNTVRILGADEIKSPEIANALDEFHLDFTARPPDASVAGAIDVPDLSGLTQSAAQRVLTAVGLRLDTATGKPPASAKAAVGQAFKQSPEAGAKADRGVSVLVVFAQ